MRHQTRYITITVALILVGAGLLLAAKSNPRRFSLDPSADGEITILAVSAFVCGVTGIGILIATLSRTAGAMSADKRSKVNLGVGIGTAIQLIGLLVPGNDEVRVLAIALSVLASLPIFVWGCMHYAEGRGYGKSIGLLGVLGIPGLAILIVLPDQHLQDG